MEYSYLGEHMMCEWMFCGRVLHWFPHGTPTCYLLEVWPQMLKKTGAIFQAPDTLKIRWPLMSPLSMFKKIYMLEHFVAAFNRICLQQFILGHMTKVCRLMSATQILAKR